MSDRCSLCSEAVIAKWCPLGAQNRRPIKRARLLIGHMQANEEIVLATVFWLLV
jgi:hypothetical protein